MVGGHVKAIEWVRNWKGETEVLSTPVAERDNVARLRVKLSEVIHEGSVKIFQNQLKMNMFFTLSKENDNDKTKRFEPNIRFGLPFSRLFLSKVKSL